MGELWDEKVIRDQERIEKIHLARQRHPRLKPIPASTYLGHVYTVDVVLYGAEPYPCIVCGQGRLAHEEPIAATL